ncbi:hypothetical protein ACFXGT_40585 [Streptomyces sp. NPDC059352]|uniref:hypothetical protein n=1 Tax=Streptomyces sp. NPDC059352 TaxID=3346810 RepID=UPI00367AB4D4
MRSARDAGHRVSLHNDGVLPDRPARLGRDRPHPPHPGERPRPRHDGRSVPCAPGLRGDLAVLARDPYTVPPERLPEEAAVSATYLGVRLTWGA